MLTVGPLDVELTDPFGLARVALTATVGVQAHTPAPDGSPQHELTTNPLSGKLGGI